VGKAYVATIKFLLYSVINNALLKLMWSHVIRNAFYNVSATCRVSYSKSVRPSVRMSVCHTLVTQTTIMWSSLENSPMTSFFVVNFTTKF